MSLTVLVVVIVVALIILFFVAKIIKSCLPKIVVGLIILGALAYVAYRYFVK